MFDLEPYEDSDSEDELGQGTQAGNDQAGEDQTGGRTSGNMDLQQNPDCLLDHNFHPV